MASAPAPTPGASTPASPSDLTRTSLEYGLNVFVWGHPNSIDRDLDTAAQSGFQWVKSLFQWRAVEHRKGDFHWEVADQVVQETNARGLNLLARLDFQPVWARADGRIDNGAPDDPQDLADFVSALVSRYRPGSPYGELQAIQIWNEPNLRREWGRPMDRQAAADYVEMLRLAYQAAKAANPDIIVVSAGLSPTGVSNENVRPDDVYLEWLYEAGMAGNYDALGVHANAQAPDPLAAPNSMPGFDHGSFYFRRVEELRRIQEQAGEGEKPVWILEFGWTSDQVHEAYEWFAVTEQQKADNIVQAYRYALANWQPWVGPMFLWVLPDPSWNEQREEYWWAIANADGSPRPALTQFQAARANGLLP